MSIVSRRLLAALAVPVSTLALLAGAGAASAAPPPDANTEPMRLAITAAGDGGNCRYWINAAFGGGPATGAPNVLFHLPATDQWSAPSGGATGDVATKVRDGVFTTTICGLDHPDRVRIYYPTSKYSADAPISFNADALKMFEPNPEPAARPVAQPAPQVTSLSIAGRSTTTAAITWSGTGWRYQVSWVESPAPARRWTSGWDYQLPSPTLTLTNLRPGHQYVVTVLPRDVQGRVGAGRSATVWTTTPPAVAPPAVQKPPAATAKPQAPAPKPQPAPAPVPVVSSTSAPCSVHATRVYGAIRALDARHLAVTPGILRWDGRWVHVATTTRVVRVQRLVAGRWVSGSALAPGRRWIVNGGPGTYRLLLPGACWMGAVAAVSRPTVTAPAAYYANCAAARAAGVAPLRRGQPGYRTALDRDRDGVACE